MDYYAVLNLERGASTADINQAYRKLALKWHPVKNENDRETAERIFAELGEAYDVLSDARRRAIYDQYGEDTLKQGIPAGRDEFTTPSIPPYTYHGRPAETFMSVFGGSSPFGDFFDTESGTGTQSVFGNATRVRGPTKAAPVESVLLCTLEELFSGCTKKVKVMKREFALDGKTTQEVEKELSIQIKPGCLEGTRVVFPEEGDQAPGVIPADLVFVVRAMKHERFTREGDNLVRLLRIPLVRALTGYTSATKTLDDRILNIAVNDIVSPKFEKVVVGEGMPKVDDPTERGNLIFRFDIIFPSSLDERQKAKIKDAFGVDKPPKKKKVVPVKKAATKTPA